MLGVLRESRTPLLGSALGAHPQICQARLLTNQTQVPRRHLFGPAYRRNPPHLYSSAEIQPLLDYARRRQKFFRSRSTSSFPTALA
jgi:hypothetical protein